jgi:hypothetical protein
VQAAELIDARKTPIGAAEALLLARAALRVVVARGKTTLDFDMRSDPPDDATLLRAILGPTGSLRAPALRVGRTLLVGFSREAYGELFR